MILGYYRKSDCADPEVFTAGVTAILSRYPERVVAKVCDPRSGIPFTSKFLPTLSEIGEACEREDARLRRDQETDARRAEQLAREIEAQERKRTPEYETELERRKETVRKWRESFAATQTASDLQSTDLADARRVFDAEQKAKVSEIIMRDLQAKAERSRQNPCVLSDAARATLGLPPLRRATEAAE